MAGPSLQLGINAAGQDTIAGLNEQLALLRTNLSALKTAKVDTGTLTSANADIKKLSTSISDQGQALRTAFAELAEAVQAGFNKTAQATTDGGQKFRSMAAQERAANQKMYDDAVRQRAAFNATELLQVKAGGVQLVEAHRQVISATQAVRNQSQGTLGQVRNAATPLVTAASDTEISAAYAQHQQQMADQAAEIRASAFIRAETEADAAIEKKELQSYSMFAARERKIAEDKVQLALQNAEAVARGMAAADSLARQQNGARSQSITTARVIAQAAPVYAAAADNSFAAEAERTAQAKAAAWIQAETSAEKQIEQTQLEMARGFAVIEKEATATKLASAKAADAALANGLRENQAFIRSIEQEAAAEVAAIEAAKARVARAQASYTALPTQRAQVGQQVQARAQLDQGIPVAQVAQSFGNEATAIAQLSPGLQELKSLHTQLGAEASAAMPKVAGLSTAMNDLHSATRGVASSFGAMFLTWGNLIPLLAGAGIASAFVETLKIGAAVDQSMNQVRVLGGETAQSVAGLNEQLLEMGKNSIFGPKALAEAFRDMTLAGVTVKDQMSTIGDVVNFAITGMTSVQHAGESLGTIGTAFGYTADGWGRVADVIAKASSISRASVEGLSRSMVTASEVHKLYGVSLVDAATNLAVLSQLGIKETNAGTALKNFYTQLSGSTGKAKNAMAEWNLSFIDDGTGKFKSMLDVVKMLADKFATLKGQDQMDFVHTLSNMRGGKDMVTLVDNYLSKTGQKTDENGKKTAVDPAMNQLADWRKRIDDSAAYAAISMAQLSVTAQSQMEKVKSSFETALVKSFSAMEPQVLSISAKLRGIFNSDEFQASIQRMATTVANATVFLLQHVDAIVNVAKALLIWKAAMIVSTLLQQTVLLITAATNALREKAVAVGIVSAAETAGAASLTANSAALTGNASAMAANGAATSGRTIATSASTTASLAAANATAAQDIAVAAEGAAERANAIATEARAVATRLAATAAAANTAATAGSTVAVEAHAVAARADAIATEAEAIAARSATVAAASQGTAMAAAAVATEASSVANAANAVSAGKAAAAGMGMIGGFMRAIPVLGTILTVGALAFELFWNKASGKDIKPEDSFIEKMKQITDTLNSEAKRAEAHLRALNKEPEVPESLAAGEDIRVELKRKMDDRHQALVQAQAELDALDAKFAAAPPVRAFNTQSALRRGSALPTVDTDAMKTAAQAKVAGIQSEIDKLNSAAPQLLGALDNLVGIQGKVNKKADELANTPGTVGTDTLPKVDKSAGARLSAELKTEQDAYRLREAELVQFYNNQRKLNDTYHQTKQISDIEYESTALSLEQAEYDKRRQNLANYITQSASTLAQLKALPKDKNPARNQEAIRAEQTQMHDAQKMLQDLDSQMLQSAARAEGIDRQRDLEITKFIEKQQESLTLRIAENELKAKGSTLSLVEPTTAKGLIKSRTVTTTADEESQVMAARLAAQGAYDAELQKQNALLAQAQQYIVATQVNQGLDANASTSGLEAAQREVERMKSVIARLQQAAVEDADKAGIAVAARLKPQWQLMVEGWQDATKQMRHVYDEMVTDFISQGESVFANFMKIGKFTAQSLLDSIRDTLVKNLYQTTLAPMMSQLGQSFANIAVGNRPAVATGVAASPIDLASQNTTVALTTMNDAGILPTTNAFALLIEAAQQAATALFNVGGGGGGGGWLGSLFGSGSGSGTGVGGAEGSSFNTVYALGAPFGFAKGSPFTNHTFAQPTRFSFAGGAAMGEMGEAGPEAVMPLKRGADGSLGVAMHSGAQMQSNVSVVVENHSDGKARVQETKRGDGQREIRVIIDAAVQEVASSIQSGGVVGSVIESQYGMNRASGIPRR